MEGPDTLVATAAYQPEPMAAAAARRFVRDTLQSWVVTGAGADGNGLVDDAVLLTSELVTNAVVHAGTPVQVTCKLADGSVEVVVRDSLPASLVPEPPDPGYGPTERTSGRGLLLPSALASAWGVTYGRNAKAVWFRIGLGGPGSAADELADRDPADPAALTAALRKAMARPALAGANGNGARGRADAAAGAAAAGAGVAGAGVPGAGVPGAGVPGGAGVAAGAEAGGSGAQAGRPAGDPGYQELLQRTVETAQAAVAADAACAMLADEDGDLRMRAAAGTVPAGAAPAVITVPFVVDGRITGLLAATRAQPGSFRDGDAVRLQEIADRTGPALERARLADLDRVRRERIGALAIARDLVAGHLGQDKVMALATEAVVPRLAAWCAVLLPGPDGRLRPAYARHPEEARTPALTWALERLCAVAEVTGQQPRAAGTRAAWRWPLAGVAADDPHAPPGTADLAGDAAWCFPFPGAGDSMGVLAVGHPQGERLPRDAAALVSDLACRLGLALANVALSGRAG